RQYSDESIYCDMLRSAMRVVFAVLGHQLYAKLPARADDPDGDLAAIRDQDLLDRRHERGSSCAIEKTFPSVSTAVAMLMPSSGRASGRFWICPPAATTALHSASRSST